MRDPKLIQEIKYYVISMELDGSEQPQCECRSYSKVKNRVDPGESIASSPLQKIIKQIPKKSNIILHLSGSQILTQFREDNLRPLFETIDAKDFFIQKSLSSKKWELQSACRHSIFMPIVDLISLQKHFVIHVSFGSTPILALEALLLEESIQYDHLRFTFSENTLVLIHESHESGDELSYILEKQSMTTLELIQLGALMQHLSASTNVPEGCQEAQTESKFRKRFQRNLVTLLAAVFVLLFFNFLVFDKLQQQKALLQDEGQSSNSTIRAIESLEKQISEYRNLTQSSVQTADHSYTFYLEEIALERPDGIWFDHMEVNPLGSKPESHKPLGPTSQNMVLKGEARSPMELNRFIESLKSLKWVRNIDLNYYELEPGNSRADFEIAIIR